jgi:hypothetical protein
MNMPIRAQASGTHNEKGRYRPSPPLPMPPYQLYTPPTANRAPLPIHSPKSPGGPSHPPGPAHGFTSYFPSMEGDNVGLGGPTASELMHMLLPAPYLSAHMTVLKGRSPIREAVERVSRARKALDAYQRSFAVARSDNLSTCGKASKASMNLDGQSRFRIWPVLRSDPQ